MTRGDSKTGESRIFKALAHPMRMRLLAVLSEREASPVELAAELDERLSNVAYHVRTLETLGCVELVRTTQRRGALEHHYRATTRPWLTEAQWSRLPAASRRSISASRLSEIWTDAMAALASDTFDSRTDRHLSWTNLVLDDQAWRELAAILAETLDRALELQAEAAARLQEERAGEPVDAKLVLMHYEAAPPAPKATPQSRRGREHRKGAAPG
jgi:DNA-binding transcriptional ArsR family regulator